MKNKSNVSAFPAPQTFVIANESVSLHFADAGVLYQ
jgi:hypothetical protein